MGMLPQKGGRVTKSCCCSNSGSSETKSFSEPQFCQPTPQEIGPRLTAADKLGMFKVRWGMGRMHYSVVPGLYLLGKPDENSPVLVTANYKLTFDLLRSRLGDLSAWILVLNTHGINVWCAAGKGTFGTDEVVRQIEAANLKSVVAHREVILPQLGAPGVAAHEVKKRTGFKVTYGPVYAKDIPRFLANGKQATPDMRRAEFGLKNRVALIPMELIPAMKWAPVLVALIAGMRLADGSGMNSGILGDLLGYLGAIGIGAIVFQCVLPWIPGRSFVLKGWLLGIVWALAISFLMRLNPWIFISNLLVLPVIAAYLALNFTGSTTFTSLSGVQKEIRLATPAMIASAGLGIILRIGLRFLN
jgi:hypothetical protein